VLALVHVGEHQRKIDEVVGVLWVQPDRLLTDPQCILNSIDHAVQRAEIGTPARNARPQGHGTLEQRDAAFRIVGMGGNHALQGERRGMVGCAGQHVVADARSLAEPLRLRGRPCADEGLFRWLGRGRRSWRCGSAHVVRLALPADPFIHCRGQPAQA
jgi:hypothetical protein